MGNILDILGAFLDAVLRGDNLAKLINPAEGTIRGYLSAASAVITIYTGHECSTIDSATITARRPTTEPYLVARISNSAAWKQPKARKECVTMDIFVSMQDILSDLAHDIGDMPAFLSMAYLVYDIERLALYTGSRLAEYGQSKVQKGSRFARIPNTPAAGVWANLPLAFMEGDFTFFNASMVRIPNTACLDPKASCHIWEVHIRFRFDKSKENFSIRKYRRQKGVMFDPITASINLHRRAAALQIPKDEPIAQFRNKNGTNTCLYGSHVRDILRQACIRAYPDPNHYCRLHIQGLVAHSNRVTAALCLLLGGASISDIAFRLRWKEGSVPTYLRECFNGIDVAMQRAISGAFAMQTTPQLS